MTEASELGPSYDGTVVLDIGGDIGAMVLYTPPSMHLAEIEISPNDERGADVFQQTHPHHPPAEHTHDDGSAHTHDHDHGHHPGRTHVAVRERRGPTGVRYAAIYPGLREGEYTIWGLDGEPVSTFVITGGQITELDWR